jgi:Tol biopolymer transport system component
MPQRQLLRLGGLVCSLLLGVMALGTGCARLGGPGGADREPSPAAEVPSATRLLHDARQLTFAGRRSGEGYFSRDGREIVFQSEREPGNPFYQIYRMDLETGGTRRISTGRGRTTCGWIHPDGEATLFASTHLDPEALAKQERELEERARGESRRYAWGFDDQYDLFLSHGGGPLERLTTAPGYDAEGAFSPDGRTIVFASNRHAYGAALSPEERERLAEDPSFFIDLYLLDVSSGETRRLTRSPGYDGGPFFSPDGSRIVWRHFSEDGARAEIHSIGVDGSEERILTRLGVMSWAPFFHPSGDYVIFTTNLHGYDDFELYLVDAKGLREPVRVTEHEGFDGLPVFSPDGSRLLWTSNRTPDGRSQLFLAGWDDAAARAALGLTPAASQLPVALPRTTDPSIRAVDLEAHVEALTDPRMEGRRAGTPGAEIAAHFLARAMQTIGLEPAGDEGRFQHAFDFTAGISLGPDNRIGLQRAAADVDATRTGVERDDTSGIELPSPASLAIDRDWRPLAFSRTGEIAAGEIVFAGYGLVAPASDGLAAIDAYAGLEVQDRWVMVFRDLPQTIGGEARQHLQRYASLRHKAMIARDRGARGILFVSGPRGRFREELIPLRFDASLAGTRIGVLSLSDDLAERILRGTGRSLEALQREADERPGAAGFPVPGIALGTRVDLVLDRTEGANVVGRLQVGPRPSGQVIVLGAHYDHLGRGEGSSSLATGEEIGEIHPGADDNASGVAVLLEIAEELVHLRNQGVYLGERDFVFAAWSAEEIGLIGSDRWLEDSLSPHASPHEGDRGPIAYLNFDMVGRLRDSVIVQGLGSSSEWPALLERAAAPLDLAVFPQNDSYLPTDATSFYTRGIPILSAFTGVHSEYHTPRDRAELLNLEGAAHIGRLFSRIAQSLSSAAAPPPYTAQPAPSGGGARSGLRVFLGTVPDYAQTDVRGVKLSGVAPGGPAEEAGLRSGDVIVELEGQPIENLYDYTYALDALRVGEPARIVIERAGERRAVEILPASRE